MGPGGLLQGIRFDFFFHHFFHLSTKSAHTCIYQQRVMRMGFDWDTTEISIMLFAKLAKPLRGTARIVINSFHIKGDVCVFIFLFL